MGLRADSGLLHSPTLIIMADTISCRQTGMRSASVQSRGAVILL